MRSNHPCLALGLGAVAVALMIGSIAATASRAQSPGTPDERLARLEAEHAATVAQVKSGQIGAVIAAMAVLDGSGLHDMESAVAAGDIKPGYLGAVRRARLVAGAIVWPENLAPTATKLTSALTRLQDALNDEDTVAAVAPMKEAHDLWHDLGTRYNTWLGAQANAPAATPTTGDAPMPAGTPMPGDMPMPDDHGHDHGS